MFDSCFHLWFLSLCDDLTRKKYSRSNILQFFIFNLSLRGCFVCFLFIFPIRNKHGTLNQRKKSGSRDKERERDGRETFGGNELIVIGWCWLKKFFFIIVADVHRDWIEEGKGGIEWSLRCLSDLLEVLRDFKGEFWRETQIRKGEFETKKDFQKEIIVNLHWKYLFRRYIPQKGA